MQCVARVLPCHVFFQDLATCTSDHAYALAYCRRAFDLSSKTPGTFLRQSWKSHSDKSSRDEAKVEIVVS